MNFEEEQKLNELQDDLFKQMDDLREKQLVIMNQQLDFFQKQTEPSKELDPKQVIQEGDELVNYIEDISKLVIQLDPYYVSIMGKLNEVAQTVDSNLQHKEQNIQQ